MSTVIIATITALLIAHFEGRMAQYLQALKNRVQLLRALRRMS